jgi:hypothetical protein
MSVSDGSFSVRPIRYAVIPTPHPRFTSPCSFGRCPQKAPNVCAEETANDLVGNRVGWLVHRSNIARPD